MTLVDLVVPAFKFSDELSFEQIVELCHDSIGIPREELEFTSTSANNITCRIRNSTFSLDFFESLSMQNDILGEQLRRTAEALEAFHNKMLEDHKTIASLREQVESLSNAPNTNWHAKYEEEYNSRRKYQEKFEKMAANLGAPLASANLGVNASGSTGEDWLSPRRSTRQLSTSGGLVIAPPSGTVRSQLKQSSSQEALRAAPAPGPLPVQHSPSTPGASLSAPPPLTVTVPPDKDEARAAQPERVRATWALSIPRLGLQNVINTIPQPSLESPHTPTSPSSPASSSSSSSTCTSPSSSTPSSHSARYRQSSMSILPSLAGTTMGMGLVTAPLTSPRSGAYEEFYCRLCTCELYHPLPHLEWVCTCGHTNIKHGCIKSPSVSPRNVGSAVPVSVPFGTGPGPGAGGSSPSGSNIHNNNNNNNTNSNNNGPAS